MTIDGRPGAGSAVVGAGEGAEGARAAAEEAARTVARDAGVAAPGALWLALGGSWSGAGEGARLLERALAGLEAVWPGAAERTIATRSAGLLGATGEWRQRPTVGVLAVAGSAVTAASIDELAGEEDRAGPELAARFGRPIRTGDAVVVWADAVGLASGPLLESLSASLAPAALLGGGLSPVADESAGLAHAGRALHAGLAAWHLPAALVPSVRTATAAHPLTPALEVTRSRGHWLLGLGGRAALDVFREAAGAPLASDPGRAARVLKVAEVGADATDVRSLSNVVGFDAGRRAFSVARAVPSGRRVALVQLDAERARSELGDAADGLGAAVAGCPAWGLYFGCRGRGRTLFGIDGLESGLIERGLAGMPWLGTEADYQIAPDIGGAPGASALTYAGVLLVARAERATDRAS